VAGKRRERVCAPGGGNELHLQRVTRVDLDDRPYISDAEPGVRKVSQQDDRIQLSKCPLHREPPS
jgi:hypothetical protein